MRLLSYLQTDQERYGSAASGGVIDLTSRIGGKFPNGYLPSTRSTSWSPYTTGINPATAPLIARGEVLANLRKAGGLSIPVLWTPVIFAAT